VPFQAWNRDIFPEFAGERLLVSCSNNLEFSYLRASLA